VLAISSRVGRLGIPALLALASACAPAPREPNDVDVVVVLIDALRADHLGCYGYPDGTSPHIDRLARRGSLFQRAYTTAPWTYASTASLVTGLYPAAHGGYTRGEVRNHSTNPFPPRLSPDLETLGDAFTAAGWRTGLFSANSYVGFGVEQGFERFTLKLNAAPEQVGSALEWLGNLPPGDRWAAVVHLVDVHEPNRPPRPYRRAFRGAADVLGSELKLYGSSWGAYGVGEPDKIPGFAEYRARRIGVYDAAIRFTDAEIGRLARGVADLHSGRETLFAITADHGEEFWDHAELESRWYQDPRNVYGLAHGHSFFDELMRIPLILQGDRIPGGRLTAGPVSMIDVLPTLLDYGGVATEAVHQGISLLPALAGGDLPDRALLLDALVYGRDKRALVDGRYKLILSDVEPTVLFDLRDGADEQADVSEEHPRIAARAAATLDSLYRASLSLGSELRPAGEEEGEAPDAEQVEMLRALGYVE
jgi:arylsulfatase A-like enzyme